MQGANRSIQLPDITSEVIQEIAWRIAAQFAPEKIILFGSRAWGNPSAESDVDLLVIMESDKRPARRSAEISMACRPPMVAMDILVRTPEEIQERLRIKDPFLLQILEKGKVLYER